MEKKEKEMKWVYEEIVSRIPPFSLLSYKSSILLQLLLLLFIGLFIGYIYHLDSIVLLYGSIGIFVAVLWSLLILQLGPTLRKFRAPLNQKENALLEQYKKILFHKNHYEMIPGIIIFVLLMLYLYVFHQYFSRRSMMESWFGEHPSPILLIFVMILLWDICYRMGLGIWTTTLSMWRSLNLKKMAEKRTELEHTPYTELKHLKKLDINNMFFGIISLLLLPIIQDDYLLVLSILAFVIFITGTSYVSAYIISGIPWLPPDIYDLVIDSKFAYVGTSDSKRITHLTPVVYVFDGQKMYFATSKSAKKIKNLRENNKVAFLVDKRDLKNIYENKAILLIGKVKIYGIHDIFLRGLEMLKARNLFFEKYPQYTRKYSTHKFELPKAWQLTPIIARILIGIEPEEIIYWRGAKQINIPV
ncbi:MAG: pyridoxamine 5'-phosphate oxidase family protein [Methanosarcinales archaeon]